MSAIAGMQDLLATQATIQREDANRTDRTDVEGHIIGGSWGLDGPGYVRVVDGPTYAVLDDSGDNYVYYVAKLKTPFFGSAYGPVGGERVTLERGESGWYAQLNHDADDFNGTPQGETWFMHAKPSTVDVGTTQTAPTYDSGLKLTNDGPSAGDGLGGASLGADGALSEIRTKSGYYVRVDDTAQRAYVTIGSLEVIVDGSAGKVYIGADALAAGKAAISQDDLTNALTDQQTILMNWARANFQAGTCTAPAPGLPTIQGSTKVFIED